MALGIADRIFNITGPDVSEIYVHCPHCGAQGYVSVTEDEGDRLIDSEHVQDVLPHMPPIECEPIISGRCPTCQWAPTRPRRGPGPPGRAVAGGCANRFAQVVAKAQTRMYG